MCPDTFYVCRLFSSFKTRFFKAQWFNADYRQTYEIVSHVEQNVTELFKNYPARVHISHDQNGLYFQYMSSRPLEPRYERLVRSLLQMPHKKQGNDPRLYTGSHVYSHRGNAKAILSPTEYARCIKTLLKHMCRKRTMTGRIYQFRLNGRIVSPRAVIANRHPDLYGRYTPSLWNQLRTERLERLYELRRQMSVLMGQTYSQFRPLTSWTQVAERAESGLNFFPASATVRNNMSEDVFNQRSIALMTVKPDSDILETTRKTVIERWNSGASRPSMTWRQGPVEHPENSTWRRIYLTRKKRQIDRPWQQNDRSKMFAKNDPASDEETV